MKTVLESLKTPSALLGIGIFLFSVFLLVYRCRLGKSGGSLIPWRILCLVPLLACVIHGVCYFLGVKWMDALKWFAPMYILAVVTALWPLLDGWKLPRGIVGGILVAGWLVNAFYIPEPTHLHNFTYGSWTDSFVRTVNAMEEEYPISSWKGIDYDALLEEFVPRVQAAEEANDLRALGVILYDYCNRFYDGHIALIPADSQVAANVNRELLGNDYGLSLITLDDGTVVAVCVEPGSEVETAGIYTGTVVTAWDGIAVAEAKQSYDFPLSPPVKENEEPSRTMLLAGQGGETITVSFLDDGGAERTVTLNRIGDYVGRYTKAYGTFCHMEESENFSYKMLGDTCGYLRIHSEELETLRKIYVAFTGQAPFVTEKVDQILEELCAKGMTTLVIDIRNNTGGSPTVSAAVATLFAEETFTYAWTCYDRGGSHIQSGEPWEVVANGKWRELPVVVLVNQNTVSAGDAMADMLADFPNVTLMGVTPTNCSCQGTGGESYLAGGHFVIHYPVILEVDQNGDPLIDTNTSREGRIPLEVEIPLDEKAVLAIFEAGTDYELEYAVDWLQRQSAEQ